MEQPETLKEPWQTCDPSFATKAERELQHELPPSHVLTGIEAKAVARRVDQDDVLFALHDDTGRVAVVHLTYAASKETDPRWPLTTVYDSYKLWQGTAMAQAARDYEA